LCLTARAAIHRIGDAEIVLLSAHHHAASEVDELGGVLQRLVEAGERGVGGERSGQADRDGGGGRVVRHIGGVVDGVEGCVAGKQQGEERSETAAGEWLRGRGEVSHAAAQGRGGRGHSGDRDMCG